MGKWKGQAVGREEMVRVDVGVGCVGVKCGSSVEGDGEGAVGVGCRGRKLEVMGWCR